MRKFLFWRLVQFPIILATIYLVAFVLVWIVPGSPLATERVRDAESMRLRLAAFHADTWQGFLTYYPWNIVTKLDFGPSMRNPAFSVGDVIAQGLPVSATVGFFALSIAVLVGVSVGTLSAVRRDGIIDWSGIALAVIGISIPSFVIAAVLLLVFAIQLKWFPVGGSGGVDDLWRFMLLVFVVIATGVVAWLSRVKPVRIVTGAICVAFVALLVWLLVRGAMNPQLTPGLGAGLRPSMIWPQFVRIVLPSLALSLAPMAYIVRLQRVSMLDTLGSDYVRTARAKGVAKPTVVVKHCLRNAFLPVFTYLGPAAATTLTGSFVVETVFDLPGLGKHFVGSVLGRDQTMILGLVVVYSSLLLAFNLLVDVGYAFIDPRIDITAKK